MKAVSPSVDFPALENEVLAKWSKENTFYRSYDIRRGGKEFAFYDGPPFANGLPHYGHLLANTIKDVVPRYWTMRGYFVERRFGWDCHGFPVEYEIEKREKLTGRQDILKLGVAQFNEMCRESASAYAKAWETTITRLGRWVDWKNQYRTMDKTFMESCWWVFSELHRKGLIYRDHKVVPYSPRLTAVLSNFEANQNYKTVQDPALFVKFRLKDEDAFVLAWTTTPWTLISNLALCVGPNIAYVRVLHPESGERYYVAKDLVSQVFKAAKGAGDSPVTIDKELTGLQLAGRSYHPLFDHFASHPAAFRILADDYVKVTDGTGIVHNAPAFGEDDFRVCKAAGIAPVDPLDEEAKFTARIPNLAGQFVKDADKTIIRELKERGLVFRHDVLEHPYPFCERTDAPLIYRAIPAWYVAVEKIKDRLVANNQKINWVPGHLRDGRMGNWLAGAMDWAISRNRFWGTPLPVWQCSKDKEHLRVFGSVAELETASGASLPDIHKHYTDGVRFKCDRCDGTMSSVGEVFDCWFESGSMPYAQLHYPFENGDRFRKIFPADFIAEGLDQTRGWSYTLSVLSAALFDSQPFKNVVVNGIILDESGKKMSKRHRNYTPPDDLLNKFGSDSVRLYMLNSAILKGEDLVFSDAGVRDTTRAVLLPLWNALSFLTTYAAADGWKPSPAQEIGTPPMATPESPLHELDRWIVSRLHSLVQNVHVQMEEYKLYTVVPAVLKFIDDLTNWYIRRSRRRFWGSTEDDGNDSAHVQARAQSSGLTPDSARAYETLYYVILQFSKLLAPFAPFTAERIFTHLQSAPVDNGASVHLTDMPMSVGELIDRDLERRMELTRTVANLGRALRSKHKLKTRQVLPGVLVITRNPNDRGAIEQASEILREELNVKEISFSTDEASFVRLSLKPNLKTLGKRLGKDVNNFRTHCEKLSASHDDVAQLIGKLEGEGQWEWQGHTLKIEDFLIERGPKDGRLIATETGVTVLLDTTLTEDLIQEGLAREIVNRVQNARKDSGFLVSDRISLGIDGDKRLIEAGTKFAQYIGRETLATNVLFGNKAASLTSRLSQSVDADVDGLALKIFLERDSP